MTCSISPSSDFMIPMIRIGFLREKHELEGRIANLQDMLEASAEQVTS